MDGQQVLLLGSAVPCGKTSDVMKGPSALASQTMLRVVRLPALCPAQDALIDYCLRMAIS